MSMPFSTEEVVVSMLLSLLLASISTQSFCSHACLTAGGTWNKTSPGDRGLKPTSSFLVPKIQSSEAASLTGIKPRPLEDVALSGGAEDVLVVMGSWWVIIVPGAETGAVTWPTRFSAGEGFK